MGVPEIILALLIMVPGMAIAQEAPKSSYMPVVIQESFQDVKMRMKSAKSEVMNRQKDLLNERYDLSDRPATGVMMSGGKKPVQEGVRVKLPQGMTWTKLAEMKPEEIKEKDLWPAGLFPLPHPNHPEGGMVFPQFHIDEIKKQEGRDLSRFDLDFDLPDHLLPEFPAPIYLTTRTEGCPNK
jgi:cytochrome c peroxidase